MRSQLVLVAENEPKHVFLMNYTVLMLYEHLRFEKVLYLQNYLDLRKI